MRIIKSERHWFEILMPFLALLSVFFVTSRSVWIDEGIVYSMVTSDSLQEVFRRALSAGGSEKQMPLYLVYEWAWTRIFGYSEFFMRLSNVVPGLLYLYYGCKISFSALKGKKRILGVWLFSLNPIYAYYLNEARPYVMLLAFSCALLYYCFYADISEEKRLNRMHVVLLLGMATHMLFVFSVTIYVAYVAYSYAVGRFNLKQHILACLKYSLLYVLLFAYFGYTFLSSGSSSIGHSSGSVMASIAVSLYYILGYGGLLFSRNDLRRIEPSTVISLCGDAIPLVMWGIAAVLSLALVWLLFCIVRTIQKEGGRIVYKRIMWILVSAVLLLLGFVLLSLLFDYSFWERHIITLSVLFIAVLLEIAADENKSGKNVLCAVLVVAVAFSISALRLRINDYYGNEDYKTVLSESNDQTTVLLLQGTQLVCDYYKCELISAEEFSGASGLWAIDITGYTQDELDELLRKLREDGQYETARIILTTRTASDSGDLYMNYECPEDNAVTIQYRGLKEIRVQLR